MVERSNTLLLVDALNLIRRIYAAQPGEDGPDRVVGARVSSVQSLERALREGSPTHAVCVFDGTGESWRHEIHPEYKAGRTAMPEALASTLRSFREAFRDVGVESLSVPMFEADDVIATAATKAAAAGVSTIILSTDKSFLQLLPTGVRVRDHFGRIDHDETYVCERFGVRAAQFVDYLALAGDSGNGISGVPGIGAKTAAKLLGSYQTLESILAAAPEPPGETLDEPPGESPDEPPGEPGQEPRVDLGGKLGQRLQDHADTARHCRRLVELRTDLELGTNLSELRYRPPAATPRT